MVSMGFALMAPCAVYPKHKLTTTFQSKTIVILRMNGQITDIPAAC
jgi:hypothetical protein